MINFSIRRCYDYALKEFYENRKTILWSWGIVLFIMLLMAYLSMQIPAGDSIYRGGPQLLFVSLLSIYYTSFIIRKKHKNDIVEELTMPASALEKYISKILLYVVTLPLFLIVVYLLFYVSCIVIGNDFQMPFSMIISFKQISAYVFYVSLFVLGNVFHPRHSIIYTILMMWLFSLILVIFGIQFSIFSGRVIWGNFSDPGGMFGHQILRLILGIVFLVAGYFLYMRIDLKKIK